MQWLETSGRALEMRTARTFQQIGRGRVRPSFNYLDTVTGLARESDVVAHFPWMGIEKVPCSLTVAVECKSSTKHPWVAFYADPAGERFEELKNFVVIAHGPSNGIVEPLAGRWIGQDPFTGCPVATHVVAAHTREGGHNPAGDAIRQAISCAAALRREYLENQHIRRVGFVCLAAVVTAAPLFSCRLDAAGAVVLQPIDQVDVWGYGSEGQRWRVYIRSEASLPDFATALRQRADDAAA